MLSIAYLFEAISKNYLIKGKVDIPKVNEAFFKKMFATQDALKRQKIMKSHIKFQSKVNALPSSF